LQAVYFDSVGLLISKLLQSTIMQFQSKKCDIAKQSMTEAAFSHSAEAKGGRLKNIRNLAKAEAKC
jgi:hypothetical protein